MKMKTIKDSDVLMIWTDEETGVEIAVNPDWYQENGTPVCPESGDDMLYVRTEIKS